jgi:hypothetical protein
MGLSQRVTELLERWLGEGEHLAQTAPLVTIDGVDVIPVNGSDGLVVAIPNHISTLNSTTELLGIDGEFPGVAEEMTNYAIMFVNVYSDVASATDGLCIDASPDGTTWYQTECYTIAADTYKTFSLQCAAKYFKIRYKNGGVAQTTFHIEVKLCTKNALDSSHRVDDIISDQDDATLNKSVLTAQRTDNNLFVPITASNSNNLRITDAENTLAIAKGEVEGASDVNKWGNAPDFDTGDGVVDIWDGTEDGTAWELMQYIFPASDTIDSVSSTDAGDTMDVDIEGLEADGTEGTRTITLNGQNRVAISPPLFRFHRGYNSNGIVFAGHIIIYENGTLSGGVPTDKTKIKGVIHPEEQQTEMAIYTIPSDKTGYLLGGYASTAGANKSSNYVIQFRTRESGGVFRTQQKVALSDTGSSFIPFTYPIPQKLEPLTDVKATAQMTATGGTGATVSAGFSIVLIDN